MRQSPIDRSQLLIAVQLLIVTVLLAGGIAVYVLSDPAISQALAFTRATLTIAEHHVGYEDIIALRESAWQAMFAELDRFSGYLDRRSVERFQEELTGAYTGIGVLVVPHDDGLMMLGVREGGPGAAAGLLPGDVIVSADSIELGALPADSAARLLRGRKGATVRLGVFRQATCDTAEVVVTRGTVPILHIPYTGLAADDVIYVKVADFEAGATENLKGIIDSSLSTGTEYAGMILDVRGNPGGLFTEACQTADLFLNAGTFIVGTDARSRWQERSFVATGEDLTGGLPLVVLVDHASASSAEVVAGALQAAGRAVLVGDTTFGKGLVQRHIGFPDGTALKLTIARYYFDGGVYINDTSPALSDSGRGLVPDDVVAISVADRFVRELETSRLLYEFAGRHEQDLVNVAAGDELDNAWIDRFAEFAAVNGFVYRSAVTEVAQTLEARIDSVGGAEPVRMLAESIVGRSEVADAREFAVHCSFIARRLRQIATERARGPDAAYRDVVVPHDTVIARAVSILREQRPFNVPGT